MAESMVSQKVISEVPIYMERRIAELFPKFFSAKIPMWLKNLFNDLALFGEFLFIQINTCILILRHSFHCINFSDNLPKLSMRVIDAWKAGYTGNGVTVTILDDGVEHAHPDLKANYNKERST